MAAPAFMHRTGDPILQQQMFLLDCHLSPKSNLSTSHFGSIFRWEWKMDVSDRYLCKHRAGDALRKWELGDR